ncbi:FixH family protein [Pelobium manganitolerans]|uniref:FixH family protein n=1 Tax=Pelobium manganitolerans TaxID=1842495 RepID=UPI003FA3C67B
MKHLFKYIAISAVAFTLASCSKDNETLPFNSNKIKIGEAYAIGAATKIQLWADAGLETGYNKLYLSAIDSVSGQAKTDVNFNILPMMTMTMSGGMKMQHSCPFEQANASAKKDGLTPAAAVFSMPTTDSGFWEMEVTINNKKAVIPFSVKEPKQSRLLMVKSTADNSNYLVALIPNATYKIGVNDFELFVTKKINGMTYTPADDLKLSIEPEMPDMGHGSPNNVNPALTSNGHYKGKVNFTMSGYWKVNLQIKNASGVAIAEDTAFNITF